MMGDNKMVMPPGVIVVLSTDALHNTVELDHLICR